MKVHLMNPKRPERTLCGRYAYRIMKAGGQVVLHWEETMRTPRCHSCRHANEVRQANAFHKWASGGDIGGQDPDA